VPNRKKENEKKQKWFCVEKKKNLTSFFSIGLRVCVCKFFKKNKKENNKIKYI